MARRWGRLFRPRGSTLVTVLVVGVLAAIVAFTMASNSIFHLQSVTAASNSKQAHDLAESAIHLAIARLKDNPQLGVTGLASDTVQWPSNADRYGIVTFSTTEAAQLGVPYSKNNLNAQFGTALGYRDTVVPAQAVHLVGTGISGPSKRSVEAVVFINAFPYALASSGTLTSSGNLFIGGMPQGSGNISTIDTGRMVEAGILSNSTSPNAIVLGPNSEIRGNVDARGGVTLDRNPTTGTRVLGEVRSPIDPVPMPSIDPRQFDPFHQGTDQVTVIADSTLAAQTLAGFSRRQGDLGVTGDLELANGVLYVDGNVTISGAVKGRGAVIATGGVTVGSGSSLSTANAAAIVAGGDIQMSGQGSGNSFFQGLLYTGGSALGLSNITVAGVFLAAGDVSSGRTANLQVQDARVVHVPDLGKMNLSEGGGETYVTITPGTSYNSGFNGVALPGMGPGIYDIGGGNPTTVQRVSLRKRKGTSGTDEYAATFNVSGHQVVDTGFVPYDQLLAQVIALGNQQPAGSLEKRVLGNLAYHLGLFDVYPAIYRDAFQMLAPAATGGHTFDFDISRFYRTEDLMRILVWKDL